MSPDILHIHWPEAFYRWSGIGTLEERKTRFIESVKNYKTKGVKLVWTIHNLHPHENPNSKLDHEVYQFLADNTDIMHHHGEKSIELMHNMYTLPGNIEHIICPHGHYLAYPSGIPRSEARKKLNIPDDAFVYTHFGAIRGYKGLDKLFDAFKQVKHKNKWLLVAGNCRSITGKGAWRDKLALKLARLSSSRMTLHLQAVPDNQIQNYMAATDCLVLSHTRGLNSGVAVLGMSFGKFIIGPKLGCIESVLSAGENLLIDAGDQKQLITAMNQAPKLDTARIGTSNATIATTWTWDNIANTILHTL